MDSPMVLLRAIHETDGGVGEGRLLPACVKILCYYLFKISEGKTFTKACDN